MHKIMRTIAAAYAILAVMLLSACSESAYQAVSIRTKEINQEVNKTDFAKIDNNRKDKMEHKRQSRYHAQANDTDKKYNHQHNEQLNQKKGWDGDFSFY
jgi:uncharacterized protein YchJ